MLGAVFSFFESDIYVVSYSFGLKIRLIPIMLELEIVPERSLGCDQWEFILGKLQLGFCWYEIVILTALEGVRKDTNDRFIILSLGHFSNTFSYFCVSLLTHVHV